MFVHMFGHSCNSFGTVTRYVNRRIFVGFRRFTAQRGCPSEIISDNSLTFKTANKAFDLRRYAANDKIFKLVFLHPFLASTIYNNTIKNKFDIG